MINLILWIVVGGTLGWLASTITQRNSQKDMGLNVAVGAVGACLAGLLLNSWFGGDGLYQEAFSYPALRAALLGALLPLVLLQLFRRRWIDADEGPGPR